MNISFEYATNLQYKVKALMAKVQSYESGEAYERLKKRLETVHREKDRIIAALKKELEEARRENTSMRNCWIQVLERRISGHTELLALIGSPVGHSGSPAMYNYSFEKLGLDYVYVALDIKVDEVKDAMAGMNTFKMRGGNVTMPCKTEVVKYMDELSPAAQIIEAVNTIVNDNRRLTGHITDGTSFVSNLTDHEIDIKGKKITVAGGGGAATAIQVQCALDGAREVSIFNLKDAFFDRTLETAEKIKQAVPGCIVNVYDIANTEKMTAEIKSSDIFANATRWSRKAW